MAKSSQANDSFAELWAKGFKKKPSRRVIAGSIIAVAVVIVLLVIAAVGSRNDDDQKRLDNLVDKQKLEETKNSLEGQISDLQKKITDLENTLSSSGKGADAPAITAGGKGFIEGSLGYPGDSIPKGVEVCAENMETKKLSCTKTQIQDRQYKYNVGYKMEIASGKYTVYATVPTATWKGYKAYYSEFVTCGLNNIGGSCTSHKPVEVVVGDNKTVTDVNPYDWYNLGGKQ